MSRKVDSLYICPWSLTDALCLSQSVAYLRDLADSGRRFALITFETASVADLRPTLPANITWYPVAWDPGSALSAKILGIVRVIVKGSWICLKHSPELIHCRTSLPAFMAVFLHLIFRARFLYDADSMLSDEYADTGHLSTASRGYRFLRWSEGWARQHAHEIIVLTQVIRGIYRDELGVKQPIDVIPCCVDTAKFQFSSDARTSIRSELGIVDESLLVYVGKVGSWYLVDETFAFFRDFKEQSPNAKLLIISTDAAEVFDEIAVKLGVSREDYFVRTSTFEKVSEWLSAADAGLALIKQLPSKRGSSPVKLAEYLSCGLPVVITDRIGDCTRVVNDNRVGVVLHDVDDFKDAVAELLSLLANEKGLRRRCREAAVKEFDLHLVGGKRYAAIYDRLLGD